MQQYSKARTSELICIPFLDSSTTPSERQAIAAELRSRGLSRVPVLLLRVLAGFGLWWNLVAWEWFTLDLYDVLFGYAINLGLVSVGAAVVAVFRFFTGGTLFAPCLVALVSALLCAGLWLFVKRGWERRRREREHAGAAV